MNNEINQYVIEVDIGVEPKQVDALIELCYLSKQEVKEGKGLTPEAVLSQLRARRK